jgi:hypothetical protein
MTTPIEHPEVRAYLRRLDAVTAQLSETRRADLRDEIVAHLRDAIPAGASDDEVAAALADLGDPAGILGEEVAERPALLRRDWIVAGGLAILSAIVPFVLQWQPIPGDVPIAQLLWGAALVVAAIGPHSITARRPLGTIALVALAVWSVGWSVAQGAIIRSMDPADLDTTTLTALDVVQELGVLALAVIAVVQIARIEVVPRPWRWAPAWVLAANVAVTLLSTVIGLTAGADAVGILGILAALGGIAHTGGALLLGVLGIALGAGVLRRPSAS